MTTGMAHPFRDVFIEGGSAVIGRMPPNLRLKVWVRRYMTAALSIGTRGLPYSAGFTCGVASLVLIAAVAGARGMSTRARHGGTAGAGIPCTRTYTVAEELLSGVAAMAKRLRIIDGELAPTIMNVMMNLVL